MEINNSITVPLSVGEAWAILTDLERIAPCLPGAKLTGRDGDDYLGTVRIKVGPVTSVYSGAARFVSQDPDSYEATIEAEGRDTKTAGRAKALVHARLRDEAGSTTVSLTTDLTIAGKVAQFGQGVIADVSVKLMEQFSQNLAGQISAGQISAGRVDESSTSAGSSSESDDVLDLGQMVWSKDKARVLGFVAVGVLLLLLVRPRRRRCNRFPDEIAARGSRGSTVRGQGPKERLAGA